MRTNGRGVRRQDAPTVLEKQTADRVTVYAHCPKIELAGEKGKRGTRGRGRGSVVVGGSGVNVGGRGMEWDLCALVRGTALVGSWVGGLVWSWCGSVGGGGGPGTFCLGRICSEYYCKYSCEVTTSRVGALPFETNETQLRRLPFCLISRVERILIWEAKVSAGTNVQEWREVAGKSERARSGTDLTDRQRLRRTQSAPGTWHWRRHLAVEDSWWSDCIFRS